MKFAFVTYAGRPDPSDNDALVANWLEDQGHEVRGIPWTDGLEGLVDCDLAVVRSTWDYPAKLTAFIAWLDAVQGNVRIANPVQMMRWNANKRYLFDLEKKGFPVPNTVELTDGNDIGRVMSDWGVERAVVKPLAGASGRGVEKVSADTRLELDEPYLIQEFLPEIAEGELSLAFFAGRFSHAVIKVPGTGEFRINSAYGGTIRKIEVPQHIIDQASELVNSLETQPLYVRVDGIPVDGRLIICELELIEPSFFFSVAPEAAERFGQAIIQWAIDERSR